VTLEHGGSGGTPVPSGTVTVSVDAADGAPQALVSAGTWQRTLPSDSDALVSCLVSPGFDFADFEMVGA
jgi:predicted cupin superfamily sugar epimerase